MPGRRVFLLTALLTGVASADTTSKQACITAYEAAQEARQNSKFRDAREQLKVCSNASCPAVARTDCVTWQAEIEKLQPSVRLLLRGEGGSEVKGAAVTLDGAAFPGEAGDLDPGEHKFKIEASGYLPQERRFAIEAGQKALKVEVLLERPASSAPTETAEAPRRSLKAPLILGGVGVIGLGLFTYFGLTGRSGEDDLKKCKPICPQSQVDDVSTKYIVADVGLGVGVIALGAATYLLLRPAPRATTSVVPLLGPGTSGLGVFGRF